jgi:hypothetical protein
VTIDIEVKEQHSALLGRNKVHDSRSLAFPMRASIDRSTWQSKAIRVYDPVPNPNQTVGCCTGVAKCVQLNAVGNRKAGRMLDMAEALQIYSRNTQIDPWPGSWPPDDTGSSGLASCKSAAELGLAGTTYEWLFGGADEVVQSVMMGRVISAGTWWHWDMFGPSAGTYGGLPIVKPTGGEAGGHQYAIRGYDKTKDLVMGRCWWGGFRDFWISRENLDSLLRDGGDAHFQRSVA